MAPRIYPFIGSVPGFDANKILTKRIQLQSCAAFLFLNLKSKNKLY
jgi:hypothetical protein